MARPLGNRRQIPVAKGLQSLLKPPLLNSIACLTRRQQQRQRQIMAAPQKKFVSHSCRWGSSNLSLQDSQTMCMEGVLVPSSVPGLMPRNGHPGYEHSAVPPQQHGGDMIHHPSHSVPPSIYPPQHHYHHPPPPPPPQGGCFPLLHMVSCQMVPSPIGQPQQPNHFAFAFPVAYWPHREFPGGILALR